MITSPKQRISDYRERGWWGDDTLHGLLASNAKQYPDTLAVADQPNRLDLTGDEPCRLSFTELDVASDQLACQLLDRGISTGDRVIVQLPNIVELVVCYMAFSKIGAIISPVPVQYGSHELEHISATISPVAIVTLNRFGALELAKTGKRVMLLEGGGESYSDESQALYEGECTSKFYPKLDYSRLRYLGGTTNHWEGSCRTLDEIDFKKRDWVANSGWPIEKKDLDPYYIRAHKYCGLGEFDYSIEYWEKHSKLKRLITKESEFKERVNQSSPPTRFGTQYHTALKDSKNITLVLNANVTNINESRPIGTITSLTVTNLAKKQYTAIAKQFVLAMGGLENSRMLLLSRDVSKNGIGNENDTVGRYYMDHPGVKMAAIIPTKDWSSTVVIDDYKMPLPPRAVSWTLELKANTLKDKKMCNARIALVRKKKLFLSKGVESVHQLKKSIDKNIDIDSYFEHIGNIFYDIDLVAESFYR